MTALKSLNQEGASSTPRAANARKLQLQMIGDAHHDRPIVRPMRWICQRYVSVTSISETDRHLSFCHPGVGRLAFEYNPPMPSRLMRQAIATTAAIAAALFTYVSAAGQPPSQTGTTAVHSRAAKRL